MGFVKIHIAVYYAMLRTFQAKQVGICRLVLRLRSPTFCAQCWADKALAQPTKTEASVFFRLGFFAPVEAGHHVEAKQPAFQRAVEERRLARFF